MAYWRVAFRNGIHGPSLWPECRRLGVAAITYSYLEDIDFSRYPKEEPKTAWSQLQSSQRASLRRFLYEMNENDIIYAKEGPMIVGKGVVAGPYQFDRSGRIRDVNGEYWRQQRRVRWVSNFPEVRHQLGRQQVVTVVRLTDDDVRTIASGESGTEAGGAAVRLPEEIPEGATYNEGGVQQILINRYERDPHAREACIARYGTVCSVCRLDFVSRYGDVMAGFIHVHHLKPLASIGVNYQVDPERHLRPACPNCHAVIHRREPPYSIKEVQQFIRGSDRKRRH